MVWLMEAKLCRICTKKISQATDTTLGKSVLFHICDIQASDCTAKRGDAHVFHGDADRHLYQWDLTVAGLQGNTMSDAVVYWQAFSDCFA